MGGRRQSEQANTVTHEALDMEALKLRAIHLAERNAAVALGLIEMADATIAEVEHSRAERLRRSNPG